MITITAVGDISFEGRHKDNANIDLLSDVTPLLTSGDICVANLECPLTTLEQGVPGKCTLRGGPGWAHMLKETGIQVVSLANNHLMDHGTQGLQDTLNALDNAGIFHVGAGSNLAEAAAPIFMEVKNKTIGFLARSSVQVSSQSNAAENTPGIAFFEMQEALDAIKACRKKADIIILMLHWGIENYDYPTQLQRKTARILLESGADIILGHHPHVLQGFEFISGRLVAYSLGNFLFDEINWSLKMPGNVEKQMHVSLSDKNRHGGVMEISIKDRVVIDTKFSPTNIEPDGKVIKANNLSGPTGMKNPKELSNIFQWPLYGFIWKIYSMKKEFELRVLPHFKGKLKISNIVKIRPRHFTELIRTLTRSKRIVSGKSTNPYE
jgi:hypothetical protein